MTDALLSKRHPGVDQLLRFFVHSHLPEGDLREVSRLCAELAGKMAERIESSPELTAGLRKLLEAKDCFVRAKLDERSAVDARVNGAA